jgi:DNA ligase (NAD+)
LHRTQEILKTNTVSENENGLRELEEIIRFHETRYYVQNDPLIGDTEYDILYKQLERLEAKFPEWRSPNSPTNRVGNDLTDDFQTVQHLSPMLSLENTYNADDLTDFNRKVNERLNADETADVEYVVEPKFDGGTITLVYENDELVRAATRGNGAAGDDITHNAKVMRTIPLKAAFSTKNIYKIELRGEAIISKSRFEKLNAARLAEQQPLLANARNAATGVMRVKTTKEVQVRGLEAFVYQISYAVDAEGNDLLPQLISHHDCIELLASLGFKVPTFERKRCHNIAEVAEFTAMWEAKRDSYDYEIDGMVVKVNSHATQARCGYTSHHPRWAVAYKFKARQATARLLDVEYQVGRTGAVTPVAKLQPIQLAGVTISSVSLHNAELIREKDIRIGDMVLVERAGDVIPYIVKSLEDYRTGAEKVIAFPTECPVCKSTLVKPEKEAIWRCESEDCAATLVERLVHFVSKDAMNLDGFGRAQVEKFYEAGMLNSVADIYRLDYNRIKTFEGFGERSVEKLRQSVELSKQNPIGRLLYALGIRHVGEGMSKNIAAEVVRLEDLKTWNVEKLLELKDVGPKVAQQIVSYFEAEKHLALLGELEGLGVNLTRLPDEKAAGAPTGEGVFSGKTILFTGKLFILAREQAEARASAVGAKIQSGVSKELNILVVGEKAGSKLAKAQKLGTVQIMSEAEFVEMLGGI